MALSTGQDIPIYTARRIVSSEKRGSSRPIVIETDAGYFLTKLRGAAQGTLALVAEIVVAALAEALGLWVPCQALILIDAAIESENREDEFLDLLAASDGINLGMQYLQNARDIRLNEIEKIDEDFACQLLWLDALVMNVDRTARNPNLMVDRNKLWLIDGGAALPFQYNWSAVLEDSPRNMPYAMDRHIFWHKAHDFDIWDDELAMRLSLTVLQDAISKIPDCFLQPLLNSGASAEKIERKRQAYFAFLWKRLKSPRPFMDMWITHKSLQ